MKEQQESSKAWTSSIAGVALRLSLGIVGILTIYFGYDGVVKIRNAETILPSIFINAFVFFFIGILTLYQMYRRSRRAYSNLVFFIIILTFFWLPEISIPDTNTVLGWDTCYKYITFQGLLLVGLLGYSRVPKTD